MAGVFGELITWLVLVASALFASAAGSPAGPYEVKRDLEVYAGPQLDWASNGTLYRGDTVRVHARTHEDWLDVSRGALRGWIRAGDVYLSGDELSRIPEASAPPFTVTTAAAAVARDAPAASAATVFGVSAGQPLNVVGRSDDGAWIAVGHPEPSQDSPARAIGWLPADAVTPDWGRLRDLPSYLPRGLTVASVVGARGSIRLASHAFWDSWAWDPQTPALWFHRLIDDGADTDWPSDRRLSRVWIQNIGERFMTQVDYDLRGTVLPAPVGGSVLVRGYGSYAEPAAPVVILEPDGRRYPLAEQHAFIASDAYHPFAGDAQWSPDGRSVLLAHPQTGGNAFVVYDRNARQRHIGIASQASFDPDGESIYSISGGAVQRSNLAGERDPAYRPIPTRSAGPLLITADGRHLVSLTGRDELIATLTASDSAFIRSWVADAPPLASPDGLQLLYPRAERLLLQEVRSGAVRRVSEITADGHFSWSPDGRWIAVSAPDGLKVFSADGAGRAALILSDRQYGSVQWSPDSRFLAAIVPNVRWSMAALSYDGLVQNWIHGQLRIYERDGRLHRIWRVLSGCDHLAWSPDSALIAYGGPGGCA